MYPSKEHPTFGIFVKNQVELLLSQGVEVEVIAIDNPSKGKFSTLKKYLFWFMKSMVYMLKNNRRISLTHAHYAFPTGLISLIGKKLFDLPYVVTVHGGDIDKMATKNAKIESITKKILQRADAVIVVGERLKLNVIEHFGVAEERVHLMSMGVDTSIFRPMSKLEARRELGIPLEDKMLLYVGNMIEAKGILDLVKAAKMVSKESTNISLYTIGSGKDESFMQKFIEQTSSNEMQIIHKLPMPQKEIAKWIAAADVFVLPSHQEGFGLVALESMAIGTPVVGTDVGGLSYLLADGSGILVKPKNPESLASGLKTALSEPLEKRRSKMEETVAIHSYDVIAQRLLSLYKSIGKSNAN